MAKRTNPSSSATAVATPPPRKSAKAMPQSLTSTPRATPDAEAIRQRAYEIYLSRGQTGGSAMDDWLQAEQELRETPTQLRERATTR